jgi:LacI family transcriptional regulator
MPKKSLTVTQLARNLNLSVTTVSFVLNGRADEYGIARETVQRVKQAAADMNYVPNAFARSLRQSKSRLIGIVFPHLRNNWAHRIITGMNKPLEKSGHIPFIINHGENAGQEARQIDILLEHRADAFIIDPITDGINTYRKLRQLGIPFIFLSDALKELPEISYTAWDPEAVSIAIQHLLKTGRRKIGYIGVSDSRLMAHRRFMVYQNAMKDAGISIRKDWIVMPPPGTNFNNEIQTRYRTARQKPDAYFCVYNDLAYEAFNALNSIGANVPGDVAIVTLDDALAASPDCYDLTVVTAPVEKEGQAAANLILSVMKNPGKTFPPKVVTGGKLIVRGSSRRTDGTSVPTV